MVANQRDVAIAGNPTLLAGAPYGDANQSRAVPSHFGECAESKIRPQTRALHFPPANAREIAGDKTDNDAAPGQTAQQAAHTGADLSREVRHASDVDGLGAGNHFRQHAADVGARHAGAEHHGIENIPIEHSGHRDALGRGLDVGGSPDRLYQRVAMMGPRPANERAIDVKKH